MNCSTACGCSQEAYTLAPHREQICSSRYLRLMHPESLRLMQQTMSVCHLQEAPLRHIPVDFQL